MDLLSARSYLKSKYKFRHNVVNGTLEYSNWQDPSHNRVLDNRGLNDLWLELNEEEPQLSVAKLKRLLDSSLAEPYDPFMDYLENLPTWTPETPDFITELASTIKTDEAEELGTYLRKWLIAMVGSLFSEEVVNHTALILSGAQGIGKTRWLQTLIPAPLQHYCYMGALPASPELDILLSNCLLINLDELAGCTAGKINQLKVAMTKGFVNRLVPYDRYYERVPRRATFAGTVNGGDFLHDETGNRRFLVVEAKEINVEHDIDVDMVYAQALHLFLTGEQYWFDKEEIALINKANTAYQKWTLEEEALLEVFEPAQEHGHTDMAMTSEIMQELATHPSGFKISISNACQRALGVALRKHGFRRVKRNGRYQYLLKRKA